MLYGRRCARREEGKEETCGRTRLYGAQENDSIDKWSVKMCKNKIFGFIIISGFILLCLTCTASKSESETEISIDATEDSSSVQDNIVTGKMIEVEQRITVSGNRRTITADSLTYYIDSSQGTVNLKHPIPYADNNYLSGIIDLNSLKSIEPPKDWPKLLTNQFTYDVNYGTIRMIPPEKMFSAAEYWGIDVGLSKQEKTVGLYVQKQGPLTYLRQFFVTTGTSRVEDHDVLGKVKNLQNYWYLNDLNHLSQRIYELPQMEFLVSWAYDGFIHKYGGDRDVHDTRELYGRYYSNSFISDRGNIFTTSVELDKNSEFNWATGIDNMRFSCETSIWNIDEIKKELPDNPDYFYDKYEQYEVLKINASKLVVEPNRPFRYTIDKMFDGNLTTSFCTPNNFGFQVVFPEAQYLEKIALVNGYAANDDLYRNNNQAKKIKVTIWAPTDIERVYFDRYLAGEYIFELSNQQFDLIQIFEMDKTIPVCIISVEVLEVYPGAKWSDTCIAELNFKTSDGWMF